MHMFILSYSYQFQLLDTLYLFIHIISLYMSKLKKLNIYKRFDSC